MTNTTNPRFNQIRLGLATSGLTRNQVITVNNLIKYMQHQNNRCKNTNNPTEVNHKRYTNLVKSGSSPMNASKIFNRNLRAKRLKTVPCGAHNKVNLSRKFGERPPHNNNNNNNGIVLHPLPRTKR